MNNKKSRMCFQTISMQIYNFHSHGLKLFHLYQYTTIKLLSNTMQSQPQLHYFEFWVKLNRIQNNSSMMNCGILY